MNLLALMYVIAVVCMSADPEVCREIVAPDRITNPMACFQTAEEFAAGWVAEHPRWEFLTARCSTEPPGPEGKDLR